VLVLPTFELGPWQVGTYSVLAIVALLVSGTYATHRLLRLDQPRRVIFGGFVLTILAGLAGVVLMSFLITTYRMARDGFLVRPEGFSVVWALIAGALVLLPYIRFHKESVGRVLDLVAPPIALGLAIGRLGCMAAGCCYGRLTDSPLGVYLPDHNGLWAVRYPTQAMSAVVDLLIFLTLLAVERYGQRRSTLTPAPSPFQGEGSVLPLSPGERVGVRGWPFDGFLVLLALILYCSKRFVMGFLRESGPPLLGPFTWMHLNALIVGVGSVVLMGWNLYISKDPKGPRLNAGGDL
jgi:phosphatidylglycerol:prolipoprotein diacylglycerol transferase